MDLLADRCTEGQLTDEERSEYKMYIQMTEFIAILQGRIRTVLISSNSNAA